MHERGSLFREVQHFRQHWLWAFLLAIAALSIWGAVQQLLLGTPFGNNPAPDSVMIPLATVFGVVFPLGFYFMNLTIEVHQDSIYYRFFPFHLRFRRVALEDIIECEVREYSAIRDYGGWGIRYGRKGKAYNVSGNRGVWVRLSSGGVMFGSQRPEGLATAVEQARSSL